MGPCNFYLQYTCNTQGQPGRHKPTFLQGPPSFSGSPQERAAVPVCRSLSPQKLSHLAGFQCPYFSLHMSLVVIAFQCWAL